VLEELGLDWSVHPAAGAASEILPPFLNISLFRDSIRTTYGCSLECRFTHFAIYVVHIEISKKIYI
jgi:hypothetical protein